MAIQLFKPLQKPVIVSYRMPLLPAQTVERHLVERLEKLGLKSYSQKLKNRLPGELDTRYPKVQLDLKRMHHTVMLRKELHFVYGKGMVDAGTGRYEEPESLEQRRCHKCNQWHKFRGYLPNFVLDKLETAQKTKWFNHFIVMSNDKTQFETFMQQGDPFLFGLIHAPSSGRFQTAYFIACWDLDKEIALADVVK